MNIYSQKYIGKVFKTNSYGNLKVVKYVTAKEVHVLFEDTGYTTVCSIDQIQRGCVKDKLKPSVYCVGVVGNTATIDEHGDHYKSYRVWQRMLERCYSERSQKNNPTYKHCSVSDYFKHYSYFKEWCESQIGYNNNGWEIDKDILLKGNKVYSEDTCCFVPKEVNALFVKSDARRGNLPIGVKWCRRDKVFISSACLHGKSKHLGSFDNAICAFLAYKQVKEAYIKEVAEKWKDQIDIRVYEALMSYEVEIDD